jgi:hypothetical protein
MKKLALALGLLITGSAANAATTDAFSITTIDFGSSERVFVYSDQPIINPAGCSNPNYYVISETAAALRPMTAAVLTARVNGDQVRAVINNSNCVNGAFPQLDVLRILAQ